MKKFTLVAIAVLVSVIAFAQKPRLLTQAQVLPRTQLPFSPVQKVAKAASVKRVAKVEGTTELVTPPETATVETYYTISGKFNVSTESGFTDATANMPSIQVAVDGESIYLQGLAYWFPEGWIKGSLNGTTATFPSGQLVGEDEYGPEYIVGSDDGSTVSDDIVFTFDAAEGLLTSVTMFIVESGEATEIKPYCYWDSPAFSTEEPAGPEVVVAPEDLVTDEYAFSARNYKDDADVAGVWYIGFDGTDVYVQGMSNYLPEAWVKGTLNGTTITFATGQYFGNYGGDYDMYLNTLIGADVVFDYDAAAGTLTARNDVFLIDNSQYYFDSYRGAVAKKVVETAAMPANPAINSLVNTDYGYAITFSVPNVDADGNGLISSKLTYVIYTDVEHDVQPLTFTPTTHTRLTESMTEIPFGFTEGYDFYSTQIYLNELYSADWNKIGIKSIYRGGGEVNETEIQWYTVKPYAVDVAREALAEAIAAAKELLNDQSLTSGKGDLLEAIQAAEAVYGNADATVEDINAAVEALQQAMEACKAASGSASNCESSNPTSIRLSKSDDAKRSETPS